MSDMSDFHRSAFSSMPLKSWIGILLSTSILMTVGCSKTVTINKKAAHQTIDKYRGNIVTDNEFSIYTASMLRSAGITGRECIDNIDSCLTTLEKGFLDDKNKDAYALFSELHLTKLKDISANPTCQESITRPPFDPYFANAPVPPLQQAMQKVQLAQCRHAYRFHAIEAVKNSYIYLFYDDLMAENANGNSHSNQPNYIVKDLDIQTKDVYEAASDALIKQIYSNRSEEKLVAEDAQNIQVTYFVDTALFDTSKSTLNTLALNQTDLNQSISSKSGIKGAHSEQVKLLNVTFHPIGKDLINIKLTDTDSLSTDSTDTDIISIPNTSSQEYDSQQHVQEVLDTILASTETGDATQYNNLQGRNAITEINPVTNYRMSETPISVDLYVPNEPEYLQNTLKHNHRIGELYASHDLNFSDLNTISQRDGLGVSYVTLFEGRLDTSVVGLLKTKGKDLNAPAPEDRIRLTGNVLLSGMVLPKGDSVDSVLNSHDFDIRLYNPHHTEAIDILGKPYYLAANFSASYGMWLAENGLSNVSYFSMLSKQQSLVLPQLYMLEPYDPNKRVLIMLHGLASSPATWVKVTNDISNDVTLRKNYQVWQIFYPTNVPMLENRYQIQQLIETAYKENDPEGMHPASQHSVLMGHSMGAVIGRMLVSNENLETKLNQLDNASKQQNLNRLIDTQIKEQNIKNRLHLKQLKNVDEAIFISAPFRGTDFADRWFTRALGRVIQLPIGFVQTIQGNLASIATEGELTTNPLGALYLQNGASQLSDKSSFMKLTADLEIADDVTYHSIIANQDSDLYQGLQRLRADITPDTQLSEPSESTPEDASSINYPDLELKSEPETETDSELNSKVPKPFSRDHTSSSDEMMPMEVLAKGVKQTISPNLSDGIVPYSSSHLEGAASETIISGGHGIQESPEAILTLRKLLRAHLDKYPIQNQAIKQGFDVDTDIEYDPNNSGIDSDKDKPQENSQNKEDVNTNRDLDTIEIEDFENMTEVERSNEFEEIENLDSDNTAVAIE